MLDDKLDNRLDIMLEIYWKSVGNLTEIHWKFVGTWRKKRKEATGKKKKLNFMEIDVEINVGYSIL